MRAKPVQTLQEPINDARTLPVYKRLLLGLQHLFTMFGSTVLVPLLTGLDISVALLMGGVCTLIFHLLTKRKIPVYLGSSFAYIAPIIAATAVMGGDLAYARGGIMLAGVVYAVMALVIYKFGADKMSRLFPPVITGSMIMVIGFTLAGTAVEMASGNWALAFVSLGVVIVVTIFSKGFLQIIPVLVAMVVGYIVALVTGQVDLSGIGAAAWIGLPGFGAPKFDLSVIFMVTPICLATMVEHIGDIAAIGATVHKDFYKDPGLHRTMFSDGLATFLSSAVGGPALTTYSENTGVLALTRVWDPLVMRIAAAFAIVLGFSPKIAAVLQTIPSSVVGGIAIILFGFIAGTGLRTLCTVNFNSSRNLILMAIIAILSLGGAALPIHIGPLNMELAGMPLAAIVAVILNLVLPRRGDETLAEAKVETDE